MPRFVVGRRGNLVCQIFGIAAFLHFTIVASPAFASYRRRVARGGLLVNDDFPLSLRSIPRATKIYELQDAVNDRFGISVAREVA